MYIYIYYIIYNISLLMSTKTHYTTQCKPVMATPILALSEHRVIRVTQGNQSLPLSPVPLFSVFPL